jgi:hypothetical protein
MRNLILSALILASAFQTALGEQDGDWTYSVSNNEATITGYTGAGGAVTIPSEVNGIPVKNIGSVFEGSGYQPIFESEYDEYGNSDGNSSITSVVIPYGVVNISPYAFTGCIGLTNISLPASCSSIGSSAFESCLNLTSVSIPNSVTSIGSMAFGSCERLYYVFISDSLFGVFNSLVAVTDIFPSHTTIVTSGLINALANNDAFVTAVANKIKATGGTYGIATQSGLSSAITTAVEPLATKSELTSSLAQSRTDGINSVLSNPNLWTLYTTSQIQNMAVGDLVLTKNVGGTFTLNYDIEQSADLQTWTTYAPLSLPLTGLPTDKAFVRIKAKQ